MINKVRSFSLKRRINDALKNRDLSQRNSKLEKLGILLDDTFVEEKKYLEKFITMLNLKENQVVFFHFVEADRKVPTLESNQLSKKQIDLKGRILSQDALDFLEIPFDVFIGIFPKDNIWMNLMSARSKAKFKIGFEGMDQRIFDLILNIDPRDAQLFETETIKYLEILNKI